MPSPGPDAWRLAEHYRLARQDTPRRGPAGERLGKGSGSSLEFQERRAYVPGDDVRHLDWGAYARTDQLMIRLYREEILPRVELIVDGSRSIAVDPKKAQLVTDLAGLFFSAGRAGGYHVRLILLGDRPDIIEFDRLQTTGLEFTGELSLQDSLGAALPLLRPGTVRLFVSDFLSPHDAPGLVRPLAGRAGGLGLVQVLSQEDAEPSEGRALRLTDSETDETLDMVLDSATVELYKSRLHRLASGLESECRRAGGPFVTLNSDRLLADLCREALTAEGLLIPA